MQSNYLGERAIGQISGGLLSRHIQEAVAQTDAGAIEPAAGYWGRQGWTRVDIRRMEPAKLGDLVRLAWRQVAPKKLQL